MTSLDALLTPELTTIAVALLAAFSIGGVIYALFEPVLSGSKRREQRLGQIAARPQAASDRRPVRDAEKRRKSVQDQLKEFEEKQKARQKRANSLTLTNRLEQAGLDWERKHFIIFSIVSGLVFLILGFLLTRSPILTLAIAFVGGLGFPRWYLARRRRKRFDAFLNELPNAVDIIVRGVKAGLPLGDCIKIVASEARDPVAGEFRKIVEAQVMGLTLTEAVGRLPDRVPLAEANFFAIVVAIQQQAGGGLSEALGNLGKVLRGRKTLKGKIRALSSEAKSSAAIIGSLPFIVSLILYLIAPDYIMLLFTETAGNMIIAGGLLWMFIGSMVMKNMINFDF
ncbi:type II secretion system F family protein [Polymorphum gilvum]|uniref:Bacterial type II secretion system protein F domain n=1 Tax=Polymorphum gilvum (strain LMG 25793 / CGMCC 1.9160 / SL003B-26A1) TaxID=991905 RepID=F2J2Q6_POLGS|nr:type II secretion system F family protein [Polymorphum gilvum]ADZ72080.1 Bacterial type II secretion system protein F domain [Polymorphum gilvum SL003B-26A1]